MRISILFFLSICFSQLVGQDIQNLQKVVSELSLKEKIGQLCMVATTNADTGSDSNSLALLSPYTLNSEYIEYLIQHYHIGGLIFLYDNTLKNIATSINYYQLLSNIPLLIGIDAEWGLQMRITDAIRFPRNMTLGAIKDKKLIYELGKEIGRQCKLLGIDINFAPVVDVNNNGKNPVIHNRSFGDDAVLVAQNSCLYIKGMQDSGVLTCAKHFPGHGDTAVDSHEDLPVLNHSIERLEEVELLPFKQVIKSGVDAIMVGHLCVPALDADNVPATLSHAVCTRLLREQLGFNGLIVTDGLGMKGITKYYSIGQVAVKALLAGADILLCPIDVQETIDAVEQAVQAGILLEKDIDSKVVRILQVKEKQGRQVQIETESIENKINSVQAENLKKLLFESSITLVRNHNNIIPIKSVERVACIQIKTLENMFSIEQPNAFIAHLPASIAKLSCAKEHIATNIQAIIDYLRDFETIIIPIFEINKFASQNYGISDEFFDIIQPLKENQKRIILVLLGTPYSLQLFDNYNIDAIIMAYENDVCAQQAAVDVICGKVDPNGKLPIRIAS